jgi:amidohydrolase
MVTTLITALLLLLAGTPGGAAHPQADGTPQGSDDFLQRALEESLARVAPQVTTWRRDIHEHPELGEHETRTARLVAAHLKSLGLEVRTGVGGTGVVGLLRGGAPSTFDADAPRPLVAWRADMDALPITEETGLPFASLVRDTWDGAEVGVMHACGHDVHTAIGLGVATVLAAPDVRSRLAGDVLFLFQPAEEGVKGTGIHGAERMLAEGAFEPRLPDAAFGLHVNPKIGLGHVSLHRGGAMAAVDRFSITIQGKQVHGAYPEGGIDPVVVASHLVVALQTIPSRNISTHEQVVLTVGKIAAGNRFNIIPQSAELVGTIRTHDEAVQTEVHERMRQMVSALPASFGATGTVIIEKLTPVTVNDGALVDLATPLFTRLLGPQGITPEPPHMGGEDFAFFARETPGLYFFLGVSDFAALAVLAAEGGDGEPAMVHTPQFSPDERALPVGLRLACHLLVEALRREPR